MLTNKSQIINSIYFSHDYRSCGTKSKELVKSSKKILKRYNKL